MCVIAVELIRGSRTELSDKFPAISKLVVLFPSSRPFGLEMNSIHPSAIAQLILISLIAQHRSSTAILEDLLAFSLEATYQSTPPPSLQHWLGSLANLDQKGLARKVAFLAQEIVSFPPVVVLFQLTHSRPTRSPNYA